MDAVGVSSIVHLPSDFSLLLLFCSRNSTSTLLLNGRDAFGLQAIALPHLGVPHLLACNVEPRLVLAQDVLLADACDSGDFDRYS